MSNIILAESCLIVFFVIALILVWNELSDSKQEVKQLTDENEKLKENLYEITEIRKETVENQKKYRNNDDVSNFNASIDFLRKLKAD